MSREGQLLDEEERLMGRPLTVDERKQLRDSYAAAHARFGDAIDNFAAAIRAQMRSDWSFLRKLLRRK